MVAYLHVFFVDSIVEVWSCDQSLNGENYLLNREGRTPLIAQYVNANFACVFNIWMKNLGEKLDFWWLERVVDRANKLKVVNSTLVRTI